MPGYDFTKNGTDVHLELHLSLISLDLLVCTSVVLFMVSCHGLSLHLHILQLTVIHKAEYIGQISIIFLLNISPIGASLNNNLLYLYMQNWYANVVRYDNFSSSFRL